MSQQIAQEERPVEISACESAAGLSKNKIKKLKRDQQWEAGREARAAKRREKHKEQKLRKRQARPGAEDDTVKRKMVKRQSYVQVPLTIVLDCGFDHLMHAQERKSLASQVTRCYSDNHKAPYQSHLVVSSFGGALQERFDGLLAGTYRSWKGVRFLEDDFVAAGKHAAIWMRDAGGGQPAGALSVPGAMGVSSDDAGVHSSDIVYLSSDSPHTLTRLRPNCTYVVGGLVDRNRHKGLCYKRALDAGVQTAKLPIGEFLQMTSRSVLATNHVVEIMLKWLELGDWGQALLAVIPKRKGGALKDPIAPADPGPEAG